MSNPIDESELVRAHAWQVYNFSFKLLGNAADAEDLAQEVLIKAIRALPQFKGESSVSTWLYRITLNTWKNSLRSKHRRGFWSFISLDFISEEGSRNEKHLDSKEPPLDQKMLREEKGRAVQEALLSLDEQSRAIIILRDLEDKSYEEIALILGIPEGTVKSRLSRARESLKDILKEKIKGGRL